VKVKKTKPEPAPIPTPDQLEVALASARERLAASEAAAEELQRLRVASALGESVPDTYSEELLTLAGLLEERRELVAGLEAERSRRSAESARAEEARLTQTQHECESRANEIAAKITRRTDALMGEINALRREREAVWTTFRECSARLARLRQRRRAG